MATVADSPLIQEWFKAGHVVEFWGDPEPNVKGFHNRMDGTDTLYDYWIGHLPGGRPCGLLLTSDARRDTPAYLVPHLPECGAVWTLDMLVGDPALTGKGHGTTMLTFAIGYFCTLNSLLCRILIDPANHNPRAIHVYEKAGFVRLGLFEPDEGPFKGMPHVLLGCDCPQGEIPAVAVPGIGS